MTSAARDARAARCGVWSIAWLASLFRKRLLHMIARLSEAAKHRRTHPHTQRGISKSGQTLSTFISTAQTVAVSSRRAPLESARGARGLLTRGHLLSVMARMELREAHEILYWN